MDLTIYTISMSNAPLSLCIAELFAFCLFFTLNFEFFFIFQLHSGIQWKKQHTKFENFRMNEQKNNKNETRWKNPFFY